MNLYIFNETSCAAVYGIGSYIRELKEALCHSHIKVCMVCLMSKKPHFLIEEIDGIRYWHFPIRITQQWKTDYQKLIELYHRNVVYLFKLYIEDKNNLIFHFNDNQSVKLVEELKKKFNCKIVTTIHCYSWRSKMFGNYSYLTTLFSSEGNYQYNELTEDNNESYRIEKAFFETVDYIICLSKNTQQLLQNDFQIASNKTTVIYNGLTKRDPISDKSLLRQKYHIQSNLLIILFVGRLDDIKGLSHAIRAFRVILDTLPQCHFIIAGNGVFDKYMKECEDIWMHVTWTGLISKDKLYDLYSIADIGIMPSFHEQCSYVAIEMMMHGIPIIGSTSTGLKEMIIDGETGLHIPVIENNNKAEIDTSLLANKMLHLLQHPEERKNMGINARNRYLCLYSKDVFRKYMLNFYSHLYDI